MEKGFRVPLLGLMTGKALCCMKRHIYLHTTAAELRNKIFLTTDLRLNSTTLLGKAY